MCFCCVFSYFYIVFGNRYQGEFFPSCCSFSQICVYKKKEAILKLKKKIKREKSMSKKIKKIKKQKMRYREIKRDGL